MSKFTFPTNVGGQAKDGPRSTPSICLPPVSHIDRQWLDRVSWQAQPPRDRAEWGALKTQFNPDADLEAGYDPFERLVARNRRDGRFAFAYPLGSPEEPFSDDDLVVAAAVAGFGASGLVCVARRGGLFAGRLDVLPASRRALNQPIPLFSWGYRGTGPQALAEAIEQAVVFDPWYPVAADRRWLEARVPAWHWLLDQVAAADREGELRLRVGDVRGRFALAALSIRG